MISKEGDILSTKATSRLLQQMVFVGPALIFFFIVQIIPFFIGIYYSFTEWDGVNADPAWVGLENFKYIFMHDERFSNAFWFTVKFTVVSVILINVVALLLALLLTRAIRGAGIFRTVFFLPNVIGGLLLGYIFQFILTQGIPAIGNLTGITFLQTPWLGTPSTAFWGIVVTSVWQTAGYMMIIYIAGILNIPSELVEAARIDGAKGVQVLKSIILPLLMPAFTICLFLTINQTFKYFDTILSLTGGGPFASTEAVAIDIYYEAFNRGNMGMGAAKAIILFVIVAIITLTQVWLTKRREVEA